MKQLFYQIMGCWLIFVSIENQITGQSCFLPGYDTTVITEQVKIIDGIYSHYDTALLNTQKSLRYDLYQAQNDSITLKPLIIFAHGGAFLTGDKSDSYAQYLCMDLAKRGYLAASIAYRLRGINPSLLKMGYKAVQDGKAAVRHFKANAQKYGIDTTRIYFGGVSAGAVIALHVGFFDEGESMGGRDFKTQFGCLDCTGKHQNFSSEVAGIFNIAGGIIDTINIDPSNQLPSIHFHGTADNIMQYEYGVPFEEYLNPYNEVIEDINEEIQSFKKYFGIDNDYGVKTAKMPAIYGSKTITDRLQHLNIAYELHTFEGDDHYLLVDKTDQPFPTYFTIRDSLIDFLHDLIQPQSPTIEGNVEVTASKVYTYRTSETYTNYCWTIEGGVALNGYRQDSIQIRWDSLGIQQIALMVTNKVNCPSPFVQQAIVVNPLTWQQQLGDWTTAHPSWTLSILLGVLVLFLLLGWFWWRSKKI